MTLKDIYNYSVDIPKEGDVKVLGDGAVTPFWEVLKKQVIEPKIISLLSLQDDWQKVLSNEETAQEYGQKAIIARTVADTLQQIIYIVERNHELQDSGK